MLEYNIFRMEHGLNYRRKVNDAHNVPILKRLGGIPFIDSCKLFGLNKLNRHTYPCWELHPVFVYKIIDELIYCDKKKILFRKF